jgi:hypothetical protein
VLTLSVELAVPRQLFVRGIFMSLRNGIGLLFSLSALALLIACGGSSPPTAVAPPSGGFSNSNLSGTYVFSVSGVDVNGAAFAIVGTLVANGSGGNGKGGITGGSIDINDEEFSPPVAAVAINGNSYYTVGVDGRGTATIGTASSTGFGNITLDFVLTSSTHGLITEFDGNASGSGTLDLQTAGLTQSSLTGPYAFSFSGVDANGSAFATVGGFTLGASGAISPGTGAEDFNDSDLAYPNESLSGLVALGPSSTPATTLTTAAFGTLTFDVYAIDSTHLKFIEMDTQAAPIFSGDAYSQPSTAITGTMAFTLAGFVSGGAPAAAGGFLVTDGAGNITTASTEDVNQDVNGAGVASTSPLSFSGTYTSAGSLIAGRSVLTLAGFFGGSGFAAYPSSGGLLLLENDDAGIMTGAAYPQSSTTFAAAQGYGLNLTGDNLADGVEVDDIAEFTATSSGLTVNGLIDENDDPGGSRIFDQVLTGTYAVPDSNGRGAIAATTGNTLNGEFGLTFYTVDGTTFPFIESDSGQIATGVFVLQNSSSASPGVARSNMFIVRPLVRPHSAKQQKK